jgi:hypothetical protein
MDVFICLLEVEGVIMDKAVNLLWTGGGDSTFRLLELLLIRRRVVKPYYVIDSQRRSTGVELARRDRIKRLILERDPEIKDLLLPTVFYGLADIKKNGELTKHYRNVSAKLGLGTQHEWLALFADEQKIEGLEICNHKNDPAVTIIEPYVVKVEDENGSFHYRVGENISNASVYHLFKYFRFPLLPMTKPEIRKRAFEYGFLDLLEHSWFCHNPLGRPPMDVRPCGTCNTCIYTINTGGIRRIPFGSRIRYYCHKLLRPRRIKILAARQGQ